MLKIFDKDHNAIGHIVKYKDCRIESEVTTGDKTLSFTYLAGYHDLQNEMYVQTRDDEYVVKEVSKSSDGFPKIVAILNLEDLQKDMWQNFSVKDTTIDKAAMTMLAGTGWTIKFCNVTKKRNAGMIQVSSLDVIKNLCTAFMCEPVFDTINKTVSFFNQRGEDKGVYFLQGLNLKKLKKNRTSYDYYTRIIPIGENGLTIESVNDGCNYLENYQYSGKVLTYIWKDESYTDPQALKEDAELKLNDLSKPETTYKAEVRDLARQNQAYSILSFRLGDTVTIIDQNTGTREKQRIKKLVEYPQNPDKNTCEIANTVLTFEELQQKYKAAADIINYTVAGDGRYTGTISVSDILKFEEGIAGSTAVGNLYDDISGMQGEIGKLSFSVGEIEANYLKTEVADLKYVTIDLANIAVTDIDKAVIANLFAEVGLIDRAVIENGHITGYLDTVSVNANFITAGTLSVERLIIHGSEESLIFALNNAGELTSTSVDTLDGNILTERTVTADKIVAHSITANEITTSNIIGSSGWINLAEGTFNYGNQLIWDGLSLYINAESITTVTDGRYATQDDVKGIKVGARNLIRNSKTLEFEDYYFGTAKTYLTDENGDRLLDENGYYLIA